MAELSKHEKLLEKIAAFGAGFGLVTLLAYSCKFEGFSVEKYQTLIAGLCAIGAAMIAFWGIIYSIGVEKQKEIAKEKNRVITFQYQIISIIKEINCEMTQIKNLVKRDISVTDDVIKLHFNFIIERFNDINNLRENIFEIATFIENIKLVDTYITYCSRLNSMYNKFSLNKKLQKYVIDRYLNEKYIDTIKSLGDELINNFNIKT
jgi:hypothetical protein